MIDPWRTSEVLQFLGFVADVDYSARTTASGMHIDWLSVQPQPSQADLDAAELPMVKGSKLMRIRSDARRIIEAAYPAWRQQSAALGLYPADYVTQMQADIASVIAASNAAEDAVDAAADIAAVDAVTPTWPTI